MSEEGNASAQYQYILLGLLTLHILLTHSNNTQNHTRRQGPSPHTPQIHTPHIHTPHITNTYVQLHNICTPSTPSRRHRRLHRRIESSIQPARGRLHQALLTPPSPRCPSTLVRRPCNKANIPKPQLHVQERPRISIKGSHLFPRSTPQYIPSRDPRRQLLPQRP